MVRCLFVETFVVISDLALTSIYVHVCPFASICVEVAVNLHQFTSTLLSIYVHSRRHCCQLTSIYVQFVAVFSLWGSVWCSPSFCSKNRCFHSSASHKAAHATFQAPGEPFFLTISSRISCLGSCPWDHSCSMRNSNLPSSKQYW